MMTGYILNLHLFVKIPMRCPDGLYREIDFVLDTGFSGAMVLPPQDITTLQLPFVDDLQVDLADGSQVYLPTYEANIEWHGSKRSVTVISTGDRPLIGLVLMEGTALYAEFIEQGKVLLQEIAADPAAG